MSEGEELNPPEQFHYSPQEWQSPEGMIHRGEKLVSPNGYTGYLEWNNDYMSSPHLNTARMYTVDGGGIDIWINENVRGTGGGKKLISELVSHVESKGFQRLVILGATQKAKAFYDKTFADLRNNRVVQSIRVTPRNDGNYRDYLYEIDL